MTGAAGLGSDPAGPIRLAWWAVDEVVRGVNPWRRFLGIAGCAVVIVGLVGWVGG